MSKYVKGITTTKTECERLGRKYIDILNNIEWFLKGFSPTKDYISDYTMEKLQELCIGLETGKLEIIKFGKQVVEEDIWN